MSLPDAVGYTNTIPGAFAGFSVPGIEVYEHDCAGAPVTPCRIDEGDVCRARWVNRQDHGYLTRVNLARAAHANAPYGCGDRGMECDVPQLHTVSHWRDEESRLYTPCPQPERIPPPIAGRARELVAKMRQGAKARAEARALAGRRDPTGRVVVGQRQQQQHVAGNAYMRRRRNWGHHDKHNESVGIRYTPMPETGNQADKDLHHHHVGLTMEGDFDCLIMAPGHVRCDFYED